MWICCAKFSLLVMTEKSEEIMMSTVNTPWLYKINLEPKVHQYYQYTFNLCAVGCPLHTSTFLVLKMPPKNKIQAMFWTKVSQFKCQRSQSRKKIIRRLPLQMPNIGQQKNFRFKITASRSKITEAKKWLSAHLS